MRRSSEVHESLEEGAGQAEVRIRQLEMWLAQRERELDQTRRLARLGTWRWLVGTDTAMWSDEVYAIYGLDPSLPAPGFEAMNVLLTPESVARRNEIVGRVLQEGGMYEQEMELVLPGGLRRWVMVRGEAGGRDSAGQVIELHGTVQDITDQKKTEMELREREQQLLELQRIARLGTFGWDAATNVVTWSDEVYRAFGVELGQPVPRGEQTARLMTPDSWERISKATNEALTTGTPYSMDLELVDRDGSGRRWVTVRGEGLRNPDGSVRELAGTVQDITDRKRVEVALRGREWELREAQRIAGLGSWGWIAAGGGPSWSEEMYRLFERDPALGPPTTDEHRAMFGEGCWDEVLEAFSRMASGENRFSLDCSLVVPSGCVRWVTLQAEAIRDAAGALTEIRGTMRDITERKLQVDALERSEGRYRSLVGVSSEMVWTANVQGEQTSDNPEWQAFTGQTAEEVKGFGWADAVHPEDRQPTLDAWRAATASGTTFHVQHRLRRHDGVYRTMQVRAVASRDAEGRIIEWVGMHTDITEQQAAQAALAESQSRFAKLYEANMIGICYPDRFGAFSDGNDEFLRIVGYTRDDLAAGNVRWDRMTPPEYQEIDRLHIAEAAARGSCTAYEKEYVRKDGTRVSILCGYALREGSVDEYIGFVMDLSLQKEAERALRDRERRFRELAESLPELVWVSEADGKVSYVNRSFETYAGRVLSEFENGEAFDMVHPDDRSRSEMLWRHSVTSGLPYAMEVRLRRADGIYRTFLTRAVPTRNDRGEIERWVGTGTDIHDRMLAEEAVRRTEKLAATGRLAASMAHEINNPLAAVTNSLYLALLDPALSEDTRGYLTQAEQELARVAAVTTQTLRFHQQLTAPGEIDLGEIMDSAYSLFQGRFRSRGITLKREYDCRRRLLCRGDEVRQVFANLLSNALDATADGGGIRIRIRESTTDPSGPGVRVCVADSGHGIPREIQKRVFEPFLSTKQATGTGLGLWVSQGIMQRHKGRILLRSRVKTEQNPVCGTVFCLFFPIDGIER